jgi:hypothetical protein
VSATAAAGAGGEACCDQAGDANAHAASSITEARAARVI